MLKNFKSIFVSLTLILSFSFPNIILANMTSLNESDILVESRDATRDEVINSISNSNGISYEYAKTILEQKEKALMDLVQKDANIK